MIETKADPRGDASPFAPLLLLARRTLGASGAAVWRRTARALLYVGGEADASPLAAAFCVAVAERGRPLAVEDFAGDVRFAEKAARCGLRAAIGVPLPDAAGPGAGILAVFCDTPRIFGRDDIERLGECGAVAAALLRADADGATDPFGANGRLGTDLAAWSGEVIGPQPAGEGTRSLYDRASALAKIGAWECDLTTGRLTWTDGVYDIFELPRGIAITREQVLALYFKDSRREMERQRRRAIESGESFVLDIRIRTAMGNQKWVRLTGDVETVAGRRARVYGLKQDVTAEHERFEQLRTLAEFDPLTGLPNRRAFQTALAGALTAGDRRRAATALLLLDLDGFKQLNDTLGHGAGDACLRQVSAILRRVLKDADMIARIGGDEFAIITRVPRDPRRLDALCARLLAAIRKPMKLDGNLWQVGASVGLARLGAHSAGTAEAVFAEADAALYAAKRGGRDTHRIADDGSPAET
ncbi:diguanylate cyclase domain-containing protein [Segnochrobactrum spirostomi]|nr:diguanylate cyclase [Segnochrobactrum spirostomi]